MRAPTLLLLGSRDPIAGLASQQKLAHALPQAEIAMIRDSGHDISLEQPELAAARVIAFLDGTRGSSPQPPAVKLDT
jgi:pimeloyl-ACP methyl ester carboxylesterase